MKSLKSKSMMFTFVAVFALFVAACGGFEELEPEGVVEGAAIESIQRNVLGKGRQVICYCPDGREMDAGTLEWGCYHSGSPGACALLSYCCGSLHPIWETR